MTQVCLRKGKKQSQKIEGNKPGANAGLANGQLILQSIVNHNVERRCCGTPLTAVMLLNQVKQALQSC